MTQYGNKTSLIFSNKASKIITFKFQILSLQCQIKWDRRHYLTYSRLRPIMRLTDYRT